MSELQVIITQEPGRIGFNFEQLKEQLSAKMAQYQGAVFTEESKTIARAELAGLRKLKESVDKRRKEVKSQCLLPYEQFESQVKELQAIIDEPIKLIDRQLKEMEAERIRKRREAVKKLWEKTVQDNAEYLPLDEIYDKKWDNATTSLKNIEKDLQALTEKTRQELQILDSSQSDVKDEAMGMYKKDRDLAKALTYINTYEANKKKALEVARERIRQEEEQRAQKERERIRREEAQRALEELNRICESEEQKRREQEAQAPAEEPFTVEDEDDALPFVQPDTRTVFYKVVASDEELEQVEMAFNSLGIFFERRDA